MYERFHHLRERPFSLTPDPDYLYPSRVHKEALSYLRYGIESRAGFIVITGDIGSGKTTMLQTALRSFDRQTSVSRLVNTMLEARELIEAIMLDFGLDPGEGRSKPHLLADLARYLVEQRAAGRLTLLVIDEAQNLSFSALEEVRMLSNLETEKSKLIQIALIGQPNLRERLARPELEQLRQRVTVSYHLKALDAMETAAYINHRLRRAAMGAPLEFPRDATELIHAHSRGVPRTINVIADAVLLFAYGGDQHQITAEITREAIDELQSNGVIGRTATQTHIDTPPVENVPQAPPAAPSLARPQRPPMPAMTNTLSRPVPAPSAPPINSTLGRPPAAPSMPAAQPLSGRTAPPLVSPPVLTSRSAAVGTLQQRVPVARPAPQVQLPYARGLQAAHTRLAPAGFWTRLLRGLFSPKPAFED